MSRYSENFQYDISKVNPIICIPESLPGEFWATITEQVVPDILPYYVISTYGRIWHRFKNSFMVTAWDKFGYRIVILRTKNGARTFRVHRIMMLTFNYFPGCEEYVVDHIDGCKSRNYLNFPVYNKETGQYENKDNLRWTTQSENEHYAFENGQKKYVPPHANAKLSNEKVIEICELLVEGNLTNRQVAEVCGVTLGDVENIKYRRSWKQISKDYNFERKDTRPQEDLIRSVCKDLQDGLDVKDIAIKRRILMDTVKGIKYRRIYTEISKDYMF